MKVLGSCEPDYVWYDSNDMVTKWYGFGIWSLLDILKFTNSNDTLEIFVDSSNILESVANAEVDVAPYEFGLTSQRYNIVDYTNTVHFSDVVIFSKSKSGTIVKNFILEIFDLPTFLLILFSFLILTSLIWLHNYKSGLGINYVSTLIHAFGALLNQGFPNKSNFANQPFGRIFCLVFMFITTFTSGLIISKLMKREVMKNINSLNDLDDTDLKIIIIKDSFIDHAFETNPNWHSYKSRLEYMDITVNKPNILMDAFSKVTEETHVMIDAKENFEKYMRTLRYHEYKRKKFYQSKAIDKVQGGWIVPKNMKAELKEFLNLNLQWLVDFGLYDVYKHAISTKLFKHIGKV